MEAAVIGVPDSYRGEAVKAFVVLKPGANATIDDLRQHCIANLAEFKRPARSTSASRLPKTAVGKVLRRVLREESAVSAMDKHDERRKTTAYALTVLFVINTLNFFDRVIGGALGEPIRREWNLSDSALGALGTAFTLLYAFVGIPLGRLSDRASRKTILAAAVFVWSALTAVSGIHAHVLAALRDAPRRRRR